MNGTVVFFRLFLVIITVFLVTAHLISNPGGSLVQGISTALSIGLALIGLDLLFQRFNLRTFTHTILGLFIGYLMGQVLSLIFSSVMEASHLNNPFLFKLKTALFLLGTYSGTVLTLRYADQVSLS